MTARTRRPRHSDQLPSQARALADPTRYAIFRYLDEAASPVGVAELTKHFGFNHNAIRQHLAKLRDAGLVTEELGAPTGPGRPALRYRPTPGAAERWEGTNPYERLTKMLIGLLRGEGTPFDVGYRAGQELAREHGAKVDALEIIEAVARRLGFEPRREAHRLGSSSVDIVLERCPFAASAVIAPDIICELHRGLAEGIADTAAGDIAVVGLVVRPAMRAGCRIQLRLAAS
jgi:predicted ArsR family transcriptional regulator